MPYKLSDVEARIVASWWHNSGSMGGALTALSTSGAVLDGVLDEVDYCFQFAARIADTVGLDALAAYCRRVGLRGPVAGWSGLSWDSDDERALETKLDTYP